MTREEIKQVKCPVLNRECKSVSLEVSLIVDESNPAKAKGVMCPEYKDNHCEIRYREVFNPCIYEKPHRFG